MLAESRVEHWADWMAESMEVLLDSMMVEQMAASMEQHSVALKVVQWVDWMVVRKVERLAVSWELQWVGN